ncbi:polysaccharide deacetylase family protein [Vulgatibacter incomptus]|uniref:NodB homology domain-containing protein n=1 Tax=Vulgatibacter incomptus TaxID=1391653 RepID=A0A0K1PE70_9BACT|nr:polysaccharide deacetylase family protein [Vulgatibacter incomptus]AKU91833.1 hypothetical protein AKJ08_2220 [Vulgatibacter incomptus]
MKTLLPLALVGIIIATGCQDRAPGGDAGTGGSDGGTGGSDGGTGGSDGGTGGNDGGTGGNDGGSGGSDGGSGGSDGGSGGREEPEVPFPNLIPPATGQAGATAPDGWTFLADDGVLGMGEWSRDADGSVVLYTEVSGGSPAGHARWWFTPIRLTGGRFYEYADEHRSYGKSRLIWSCQPENGERRFHYAWQTSSASVWTRSSFRFYVPETCDVTVMNVLDHPGYLETRHHELREVAPAPLPRPLVSIAFDDGYASSATVAAPALEALGMHGSFYLVNGWLGRAPYLAADAAASLARAGHELGCHSASHPVMPDVPAGQLRDEIEGCLRQVERLGASGGLAYPFGEFDEVVETYAKTQARYIRTSLSGLNDATVDPSRIRILAVTTETTTAEIEQAIDSAAATSTWLVLLFHDLGTPNESDPYTTDRGQFDEVLRYLASSGNQVLPVGEALDEVARAR